MGMSHVTKYRDLYRAERLPARERRLPDVLFDKVPDVRRPRVDFVPDDLFPDEELPPDDRVREDSFAPDELSLDDPRPEDD